MSRFKIKFLIIALLGFFWLEGFSQAPTTKTLPEVWDLAACLQYAKENNIQLQNLKLDKQSAEQNQILAKAAVLPDLSGSASQSFNHYNLSSGSSSSINASGSYGLNSTWTLYQAGYLKMDIQQKDLAVQSANFNILQTENDITLQITQAYLNILLDKESIIYNRDLVATSIAQLEQAQKLYDAGATARKNVVQLEAQLASDQYNLTASENAERQDKITLKQLLQLPELANFEIVKPDTIITDQILPELSDVQEYALANRPEIKNAALQIQIADLSLGKAKAGYLPTITLSTGMGTSYANDPTYNALQQFTNNFHQQASINLSIPIFTKKRNQTNVALANIASEKAQLAYEDTRTSLSLTTENAFINAQNSKNQLAAAAEQLKYNEEAYRIANEELELGEVDIVDFYQQRNLYVQALQSNIQAKYNALLAAKIYEFYIGEPINL
ncbi:TolC family protein [Albibacterium sp.]|uniref:TolC family protein n=1 Tax=Albibacterium sp. TaxID=2952885 RepID=UPI002C21F7E2|nr:TolC family protein [Albibacterium sp.]HUH20016.1 TolC family protein [Albibacterium sp.]